MLEDADHTAVFAPHAAQGMRYHRTSLTEQNLEQVLAQHAGPGDLVINLTAGVDAISIMDWCQANRALYVDTSLEPWAAKYKDDLDVPMLGTDTLREPRTDARFRAVRVGRPMVRHA